MKEAIGPLDPTGTQARRNPRHTKTNHGFSLIELIITVAIIAILAAVAIPIFNNQKRKASLTVAVQDGHSLQSELASVLAAGNITTGSGDTSSITTTGTPPTALTINYGTGASPATSGAIPIRLSPGTTISGNVVGSTTNPTTFCLKVTNNGESAVYSDTGYNSSSQNCSNGSPTPSLVPASSLAWSTNQSVTITDENGWKKAVTNQSSSTPGMRVAINVPVTPNTTYTYSIDAYKSAPGAAYLYVADMSWNSIAWTGAPLTTTPTRLSTTFNSGSNSVIQIGALWSLPGGTGSTIWMRNPTLTQP